MPRAKPAATKPAIPAPPRPVMVMESAVTKDQYYEHLSLQLHKLGTGGTSFNVDESVRGQVALCLGISDDDSELTCNCHLTKKKAEALVAWLQAAIPHITFITPVEDSSNNNNNFDRV